MEALKQNIVKIYGEYGKIWLSKLQDTIKELQLSWGLSNLKAFPNLSYSYVLSGLQGKHPVILKLSPDASLIENEAVALNAFEGFGAVTVLGREEGALLLEQALPGDPLKSCLPNEQRIKIACSVIDKLHQAPIPSKTRFPEIEKCLAAIDKEWDLPKVHLQRARYLKNKLINKNSRPKVFLHGDLHQENILFNGNDWVVIDPKGMVGNPIHEIWACVEDPSYDLKFLANYFAYPFQEVVEWYYVHLILASCWQTEGTLDPSLFLNLAQSVLPMIEARS